MEKPQFDGKAIKAILALVERHGDKQQHSQQPSSDAAEGHGRVNASAKARKVL